MRSEAVGRHYQRQQRRTLATLLLTRRTWRGMGPDLDSSWGRIRNRLTLLVGSSQLGAARESAEYLDRVIEETGLDGQAAGELVPEAFAGTAGDGRSLEGLLYGAVVKTRHAQAGYAVNDFGMVREVRAPMGLDEALAEGEVWLDMAVQTALADAERGATQAGITARPRIEGWVRYLNPPSCSRCVILAGRWYPYSRGFERHENCDCRMQPANEAGSQDFLYDPVAAIRAGQVTDLSKADTKAILEDDADPFAVVTALRGMKTAGGLRVTTTGRRGGRRGTRLRPDAIYRLASDRQDAIRLLKVHGYLR